MWDTKTVGLQTAVRRDGRSVATFHDPARAQEYVDLMNARERQDFTELEELLKPTSRLWQGLAATTITHDYEPGDTAHPMSTDPACRICGERKH